METDNYLANRCFAMLSMAKGLKQALIPLDKLRAVQIKPKRPV